MELASAGVTPFASTVLTILCKCSTYERKDFIRKLEIKLSNKNWWYGCLNQPSFSSIPETCEPARCSRTGTKTTNLASMIRMGVAAGCRNVSPRKSRDVNHDPTSRPSCNFGRRAWAVPSPSITSPSAIGSVSGGDQQPARLLSIEPQADKTFTYYRPPQTLLQAGGAMGRFPGRSVAARRRRSGWPVVGAGHAPLPAAGSRVRRRWPAASRRR